MVQQERVRLALLGAGPIGLRHLEILDSEVVCETVAVVDPSPAGAKVASKYDVAYYPDLSAMLDEIRPDGVINATPNKLHVPLSLTCLDRGIPVLVEKPVSDSLKDALDLANASERHGVPVLVGHHRRFNPIVRKAREIVSSGELGHLTAISATWLAHKPEDYFDVSWRSESGGGPVMINLIHDIDSLRFIAGDIEAVQAMTSNARRGFQIEDTAAILFRFKGGALATIMLSDTVASPWSWELTSGERTSYTYPNTGQDCYLFAGTKGSLGVPTMTKWRHDGARSWQVAMSHDQVIVEAEDPLQLQARHFAHVICGQEEPITAARDAAKTLEVVVAIHDSALSSSQIVLP